MTQTNYVSPRQFSEQHGLSLDQVLRWIRLGHLPHVRLGRDVLVPLDAIDLLLPKGQRLSREIGVEEEGSQS